MSLLDTASLIVTPNGYKEGKLYSVIPSDGSGDLSVTRATTATRVNSAGLVELVPYNLAQYSEDFTNSAWTKSLVSISANADTAPNGTLTADKIIPDTSTNYHTLVQAIPTQSYIDYTFSVYVKSGGYNYVLLNTGTGTTSGNSGPIVNLSNGTIAAVYGSTDYGTQIENVGNGWYKVTFTFQTNAFGSVNVDVNAFPTSTIAPYSGDGTSGIYAWGYQLVEGSTALPYQKTETRLNIPRLDYSNGTCPSILVEPQRTNTLFYSEQFDNAYWSKGNTSITVNAINSPSGILNADKLVENSANSNHIVETLLSTSVGQPYTTSIYFKKGERNFAFVGAYTNELKQVFVNLTTGAVTNTVGTILSSNVETLDNGWFRVSLTFTSTASVYAFYGISDNGTNFTYQGDGTSGIYLWGAQLEAGSYATSYIPTTSASVTRNADVISKTSISSLIGQTEGVFYSEFTCDFKNSNGAIPIYLRGSGGGGSYSYSTYVQMGANNFNVLVFSNNVAQLSLNSGTLTDGQMVKMAFAYKANDFVLYINGVQTSFYNAGNPSIGLNALDFGNYFAASGVFDYDGYIKSFALWKTRLTNTQLAQLTTI